LEIRFCGLTVIKIDYKEVCLFSPFLFVGRAVRDGRAALFVGMKYE
jgi:hypothetical protein